MGGLCVYVGAWDAKLEAGDQLGSHCSGPEELMVAWSKWRWERLS